MASPVKQVQTEPIPLALVAANLGVLHSSVIDVSTYFSGTVYWDFAPTDNTLAAAATQLSIQMSQKASGDDAWVSLQDWLSPTVPGGTITCTAAGGTTALTASASTGAMNRYFIYEAGTIANSDFVLRVNQTGLGPYSVTVEDNIAHAHLAGTPLLAGAERFAFPIDLTGVVRIRFSIYNNLGATNRPVVSRVALTTVNSIG